MIVHIIYIVICPIRRKRKILINYIPICTCLYRRKSSSVILMGSQESHSHTAGGARTACMPPASPRRASWAPPTTLLGSPATSRTNGRRPLRAPLLPTEAVTTVLDESVRAPLRALCVDMSLDWCWSTL